MKHLFNIMAIGTMLIASLANAADSRPNGGASLELVGNAGPSASERSSIGGLDFCGSYGNQYFCERSHDCRWDYRSNRCENRNGGGGGWERCDFIRDYSRCVNAPGCEWDRGRCDNRHGGGGGGWGHCSNQGYFDCAHTPGCSWNQFRGICDNNHGGGVGGGFPSRCNFVNDYRACSIIPNCYWNPQRGCQSTSH